MTGKAMAIVAAALCAGFFASAVPDAGHDVANGPVEDSGLVAPHVVTLDRFAALWTRSAAPVRGLVKRHHTSYSWDHKNARSEGWPYCDPACWRSGQGADSARVGTVLTVGQSAAGASAKAVNRIPKGDRLPEGSLAKVTQPLARLPTRRARISTDAASREGRGAYQLNPPSAAERLFATEGFACGRALWPRIPRSHPYTFRQIPLWRCVPQTA